MGDLIIGFRLRQFLEVEPLESRLNFLGIQGQDLLLEDYLALDLNIRVPALFD